MKKAEVKSFGTPDEVRTFPQGPLELIKVGGAVIGRAIFEPCWKWSESVQPLAKTKTCKAPHFQYHVSGRIKIRMDAGTEYICKTGDVSLLPSGHDSWVEGNEPVVVVDFQGMVDYAKKGLVIPKLQESAKIREADLPEGKELRASWKNWRLHSSK